MVDENVLDGMVEELNVEIPLFPDEQKRKFKKFNELKKFIDKEVEYWKPWHADQVRYVFLAFQGIQSSLRQALETSDQELAQEFVRNAVDAATRPDSPLPYSETVMGKFLGELHARNSTSANSAYNYLVLGDAGGSFYRDKNSFDGLLLAFHFSNANAFSAKIAAAETSFTKLVESYQAVKDDLEQKADKLMADMASWQKTFSKDATTWKEAFEKQTQKWRDGLQNAFDEGIQSNNQQFTTFCEENRKKFDELEKTFGEKLRLEGPAKYWDTFADDYEKR